MNTPLSETPMSTERTPFRSLLEHGAYIVSAVILALLVQQFLIRPFIVNGTSMDPTFATREYLLIDRLSYRFRTPARGEVIVFRAPPEPTKYFIKRVIGLPGDTVKIANGSITIFNQDYPKGFTLSELFITHTRNDTLEVTVPVDSYFVMGDNRSGSYDSRAWGTLPKEEISGRALLRLLPLSRIDYLPGNVDYTSNNQ